MLCNLFKSLRVGRAQFNINAKMQFKYCLNRNIVILLCQISRLWLIFLYLASILTKFIAREWVMIKFTHIVSTWLINCPFLVWCIFAHFVRLLVTSRELTVEWCTTVCRMAGSKVKVKVTSPSNLNSFHFQNLSPPPFTTGAGKWPLILKLGHNI